jgi:SAM-dependent methyltransferase
MADNPWLTIPAADYEGHMGPDGVGQLAPLHDIFARVYRELRPARVAVLGCGTGNGLDAIDPAVTERLVGVDLNPEYIALARRRHARLAKLAEWLCASVEDCALERGHFNLVHAALLFEHVDPAKTLPRITPWLAEAGVLCVVLQQPAGEAPVSETPFASLRHLDGHMRLVAPHRFCELAPSAGLALRSSEEVPLPRGKSFWVGQFVRP